MVVELKVGNARRALAAEKPPQHLGDVIEDRRCEFLDAAKKMSPEELFDVPPLFFPMTHEIEGCDL
eukprot:4554653-Pyramimonas_sp.AAC.1